MELTLEHQQTVNFPRTAINFVASESDLNLLVFELVASAQTSWYKAGYLNAIVKDSQDNEIFLGRSVLLPVNRKTVMDVGFRAPIIEFVVSLVAYLQTAELYIYKSDMPIFFESASNSATQGASQAINITSTAQELIPANAARKGLTIRNKGSGSIFLGFSNAVSTTNYFVAIGANGLYEFSIPYASSLWLIATANRQAEYTEFL